MKAYRTADGSVRLFRPDCNAKRFQDSVTVSASPRSRLEDFVQAVETLVDVDRDWVPPQRRRSLYIRPFVFANDVGKAYIFRHYLFCIICAPSGLLCRGPGSRHIYVEDEYIRCSPSLTGFTKCVR